MRHLMSMTRAEGHWAVLEFCGSVLMSPAGWDIAWRTSVSWKSALVFDIFFDPIVTPQGSSHIWCQDNSVNVSNQGCSLQSRVLKPALTRDMFHFRC